MNYHILWGICCFWVMHGLEAKDDRTLIVTRLEALSLPISVHYSSALTKKISEYTDYDIRPTEALLSRMVVYFPLIERALRESDLPESLKYMVVVESRIDPLAVSLDGAVGLWQFMPETAEQYGLIINDQIDERRDVLKSTQAAIAYLKDLYVKYEDWGLVMSAYNGGVSRVNRIIRKAGSSEWSKVRKHLPREMKHFEPQFLAAAYLCNYYNDLGLQYARVNPDELFTDTFLNTQGFSLTEIAKRCHLPSFVIYELNPQYKKNKLPISQGGFEIIIPSRVKDLLLKNISIEEYVHTNVIKESIMFYRPEENYSAKYQDLIESESIFTLGDTLNVDPYILKYYNNLSSLHVDKSIRLKVLTVRNDE